MKSGYIILLIVALFASPLKAGTTNFITRTNSPGTVMSVPVKTSELWRRILPTETPQEALFDLGITSGPTGLLFLTNNFGGTNGGRYVSSLTSPDSSITVTGQTNDNGGVDIQVETRPKTAVQDGYIMAPVVTGPSNLYWLDFGVTNSHGEPLIYAHLKATNDTVFVGATNCRLWSLLSFDVFSSGTRTLFFPTNLFLSASGSQLLTTNGMTVSNSCYSFVLTNNQLLRMTVQSNPAGIEPQFTIKP